jgi:translation initiation factor IF-3
VRQNSANAKENKQKQSIAKLSDTKMNLELLGKDYKRFKMKRCINLIFIFQSPLVKIILRLVKTC